VEKFICSSCNCEKEGKNIEWYEIFSHNNRGIKLDEELIYVCNHCGAKICKDCKDQKIKTSAWSGWEKAICPCCNDEFSPPVMQELERGKKNLGKTIITPKNNEAFYKNNSIKTVNDGYIIIPTSVSILKVFAWIDLIASFIFAIVIWIEPTPYGIGFGVGVLLQGIFVCALFQVIAIIAENLISINHNTTKLKNRMNV